ncbi:MAG: hypothetical protein IT260_22485 [Saprospiraceae bacterium]|nr:hypothetical protein [Saprospiraceae bacterium]
MKQSILLGLFLSAAALLGAQSPIVTAPSPAPVSRDPARLATEALQRKYQLDQAQTQTMYTIQRRKFRNLAEIEPLKAGNPALYTSKTSSIQRGTQASIRRMLNTPAQWELYNQTQAEQRIQRQAKAEALKAQGADQASIDAAVLSIYLE